MINCPKSDMLNGWGLRFQKGRLAVGNWKHGTLVGDGILAEISNKRVTVGHFKEGVLEGWGTDQRYYGMWKGGLYDGSVSDLLRFYFDNGRAG
jgi:hypothetical protein